jgi:hypothetical protein
VKRMVLTSEENSLSGGRLNRRVLSNSLLKVLSSTISSKSVPMVKPNSVNGVPKSNRLSSIATIC